MVAYELLVVLSGEYKAHFIAALKVAGYNVEELSSLDDVEGWITSFVPPHAVLYDESAFNAGHPVQSMHGFQGYIGTPCIFVYAAELQEMPDTPSISLFTPYQSLSSVIEKCVLQVQLQPA